MLEAIGVSSMSDLLVDIPQSLRLGSLQLPDGLSEFETMAEVSALAGRLRHGWVTELFDRRGALASTYAASGVTVTLPATHAEVA